jgi:hypothetical protein
MQDFVINQAKKGQQCTATVKEDSLTKQFIRRTTVTGGSFSYTLRHSNTTEFFHQDTLKLQALRKIQAGSATQQSSGGLITSI